MLLQHDADDDDDDDDARAKDEKIRIVYSNFD